MTLDRASWPKTKSYDVVQVGPDKFDVVPHQECTKEELREIALDLMAELTMFVTAGRKLS